MLTGHYPITPRASNVDAMTALTRPQADKFIRIALRENNWPTTANVMPPLCDAPYQHKTRCEWCDWYQAICYQENTRPIVAVVGTVLDPQNLIRFVDGGKYTKDEILAKFVR